MSSGIMDFFVSSLNDQTVHMTKGSPYGDDQALLTIGDGKEVSFQFGGKSQKAKVYYRSGGESFANHFEMNAALAKQLKLIPGRRYKLTHDAARDLVLIQAAPVSTARAVYRQAPKLGNGIVSIGYELISRLGLPDQRGYAITLKHGTVLRRMLIHSPSNMFENQLKLSASTSRALRMVSGVQYRFSYDQRTHLLHIIGGKPPAAG